MERVYDVLVALDVVTAAVIQSFAILFLRVV